jgi:hypothetical protein
MALEIRDEVEPATAPGYAGIGIAQILVTERPRAPALGQANGRLE